MSEKWIVVWWQYDYEKHGVEIWPLSEYESEIEEEKYARQQLWGGYIVKTQICETREEARETAYGF